LFAAGGIRTPEGIRPLIEAVYDETLREPTPLALVKQEARAADRTSAATATAQTNVLQLRSQNGRPHVGYNYLAGAWDSDTRTPTRLAAGMMRIRLGRLLNGVVHPWAQADDPRHAWALSEVPVRVWQAASEDESDPAMVAAVAAAKRDWGRYDNTPLVALVNGRGRAINSDGKLMQLAYDTTEGLTCV
jgi:CRISPR-associated endonuclease/helicase Cas3